MKTKKIWRNLLVFALTCMMVCGSAIPAFAALVSGEDQTLRCKILYLDGSNVSFGEEWSYTYKCAYKTGHSGYNHLINNSDLCLQRDAAIERLGNDSGWEIVGWTKTASRNPQTTEFKSSGTTVTSTNLLIYIVAKKAAPATSTVILDAKGGSYANGQDTLSLTGNVGDSVYSADGYEVPTKDGYTFRGWAATASAETVLNQLLFGAKGTTTIYYAVWEENIIEETTFDVVYYSYKNTTLNHTDTVNMADLSADGTYNVLDKLDSGYLYGGTFSDEECTMAYPFKSSENGMCFTPEAGETYYVWELDAKYLAPRNYLIWRFTDSVSSFVHVSDLYMLFALDRLNYREAGFDVNVQEGGGGLLSLDANRRSLYKGDSSETGIAFETIEVVRPDLTQEDFLYVKDGRIYSSGKETVDKSERDPGYIVLSKLNSTDFEYFSKERGNAISFIPYYITVDGIRVTGTTKRTCGYRGDGLGEDFKTIDSSDEKVKSAATPVDTSSKLNLFRAHNDMMRSAGNFSVENGGVENASPKKPIFEKPIFDKKMSVE